MFLGPAAKPLQRLDQCPTEPGQGILHFRRHDRIHFAFDETVTLETAQRLRQHFLRNAADLPLQLGVTHRAAGQNLNHQRRPFVCDPIQHEAGRTLRL